MATKKTKSSSREALVVLGMHRAGTSALSGVLAKLGAQAPKSLMPPTQDNPLGYWESTALMKFHDRVLESGGTRWDEWDGFNPEWMDSPAGCTFVTDLSALLEAEYGDARLILVKDPRMCRLFPLWASALAELGIAPKVVIPVRHPDEVVKSLAARDQMGRGQAQLLWLRHLLDAEASTRGVLRAFLRYTDLLDEWRPEVERLSDQLQIKWPRQSSATAAEINDYLTPRLRHHTEANPSSSARSTVTRWVNDCYRLIDSLIDNPRCPDSERQFDLIRQEFNETSGIYAPVVHEQRQQLERKLGSAQAEADRLAGELGDLGGKHEALQQENLLNYRLYEADHKTLAALGEELKRREGDYAELMSRHEVTRAKMTGHAEKESQALIREAELASELERAKASCSQLETEHRRQLEEAALEIERIRSAAQADKLLASNQRRELEEAAAEIERTRNVAQADRQARESQYVETVSELRAENRKLAEAARVAEESLQERFIETADLARIVLGLEDKLAAEQALLRAEREESIRALRTASEESGARLQDAARVLSERDNANRALEAAVDEGSFKIRALEKELEARAEAIAGQHAILDALRSTRFHALVSAMLRATRSGVGLHPAGDERSDEEILRRTHLLDREWYLKRYPDVRSRGMDPARHYLKYGSAEGRDPCACFSTRGYVSRYPDVIEAGINPLVHYLKYGRDEGRAISAVKVKVDNAVS